mmetsp:Transcript_25578/g.34192  ORF Transcript_25578/g.34192 Transcript_25578/m.34192 type:complete len:105 (+) Transcript_25578:1506-1820(+)
MEVAIEREQSLSQGEAIDKFMPTGNVMRTMQSIDEQKSREIAAISKGDPSYEARVKEIETRAKQTKYKAMKNLNTANEKIPSKVKANMVRRSSLQITNKQSEGK